MKDKFLKLSANENFYGCSPMVKKAIEKKINEVSFYSDPPVKLEEALAEKFNINALKIAAGAGSVRLIDGIIQSFVEPGKEILTFDKTFIAYSQLASFHKRTCATAPLKDYRCDINNLIPLVNAKTKVIFLANPNNPTGTIISHDEVERLMLNISSKIYVVLDEAYSEYVTDKSFPDSQKLQNTFPNLIILRTFSKVYGLAGLRIGYAIASEKIISVLKQNRIPHFMNCFSTVAALAALSDKKFVQRSILKNENERDFLYKNLKKTGYHVIQAHGNFLYVVFEDDNCKMKVYSSLKERGILVCNLAVFGQDKSLRIGIGDRKCGKKILACLKEVITN